MFYAEILKMQYTQKPPDELNREFKLVVFRLG